MPNPRSKSGFISLSTAILGSFLAILTAIAVQTALIFQETEQDACRELKAYYLALSALELSAAQSDLPVITTPSTPDRTGWTPILATLSPLPESAYTEGWLYAAKTTDGARYAIGQTGPALVIMKLKGTQLSRL